MRAVPRGLPSFVSGGSGPRRRCEDLGVVCGSVDHRGPRILTPHLNPHTSSRAFGEEHVRSLRTSFARATAWDVDSELRQRERDFAAAPSPSTLRPYLRELALAGRASDIAALTLQNPEHLTPLGAAKVVELGGSETRSPKTDEELTKLTPEDFKVQVVAWHLPLDLMGLVFIEVRRTTGATWSAVLPGDEHGRPHADLRGLPSSLLTGAAAVPARPSAASAPASSDPRRRRSRPPPTARGAP
jgi:hypothetical protein